MTQIKIFEQPHADGLKGLEEKVNNFLNDPKIKDITKITVLPENHGRPLLAIIEYTVEK